MHKHCYYNHSTPLYDLYLSYKPEILKIKQGQAKWFQSVMSNSSMTEEVRNHLETTQNVFQCLKDPDTFEIDKKTGQIKLVTYLSFKNKKIQKKSIIELNPATLDEIEVLQLEILSLKHEIEDLRRLNQKTTPSKKIQNEIHEKHIRDVSSKLIQYFRQQVNDKLQQREKRISQYMKENDKKVNRLIKENHHLKEKDDKNNQLVINLEKKIVQLLDRKQQGEKKTKNQKNNYQNKLYLLGERVQVQELKMATLLEDIKSNREEEEEGGTATNLFPQINQPKKKKKSTRVKLQTPFDTQTPFVKDFVVNGNKVTFRGKNGNWKQILSKTIIERNLTYTFKIKILKTQFKEIKIGVLDRERQKDSDASWNSDNAVCYYGWGRCYYGYGKNKQEGDGFSQGEVVVTEVNLSAGTIQWKVEGMRRAGTQIQLLKDYKRDFVPYVEMFYMGDSIQWV